MSDVAIRVEGLSKSYRITAAQSQAGYKTLQEDLLALPRRAWSAVRGNGRRGETFWALKDVSFEVKEGEVLGIIGRNGAGKSTVLKILSRITEPTSGRAVVYGRVGSLLEVGTGFHQELTGRENIYLSGAILGMTRREVQRKFDEIVDFAGIEKFLDTPAKHYSSGMYMRLAFAVAAHLDPEILLVDEVLAVGDAEFQKKCLGKMGEVARGGRTVVFVSHNMAAIQRLCSICLFLRGGIVNAIGATSETIASYLEYSVSAKLSWVATAPLQLDAYFTRVYVADEHGRSLTNITTATIPKIVIEYTVSRNVPDLHLSLDLLDASTGEVIFTSSPLDAGTLVPETTGNYHAYVEFRHELFLHRTYHVRVALYTVGRGSIDRQSVLAFVPTETASLANITKGGRLGLIVLPGTWSIQKAHEYPNRVEAARQSFA